MAREIHLKKDDNNVFRLPVVPSTFNLQGNSIINSENIVSFGEVGIYGGQGLKSIDIESFFPNRQYSFNAYKDVPKPYECVDKIRRWFQNGIPIRLIITDTDINMLVLITSFTYGEQDGTGDVYYSLTLQEYRQVVIKEYKPVTSTVDNTSRPSDKDTTTQKTHKVIKGDCLWNIAQKYYGKGSEYPKIQNANKTKYPSLAKNASYIQIGWELIIP